ncbi:hypothetical protein BXZ70DRAFT_928392 [Cristinia sonorae]|uniref:YABBY protein C-terminal domain-containing protein n=1 Tax=Cristinia sonorae TaxID=1940300 RepID=A0A8K0USK5_9AGAR|nr:hypothetical protein BXZ70DRAFT_928392 [Cristinia sonorae]
MVNQPAKNASSDAPKKTKSGKKGGGKKKLTQFNKFMQTEMARLKEEHPGIPHKERFKLVVQNWNEKKGKD